MKILHTQAFATALATAVIVLACLPTDLSILLSEGLLTAAAFPALGWAGLIVTVSALGTFLLGDFLAGDTARQWGFGISVPLIFSPVFTIFWILLLADAGSAPVTPDLLTYLAPVLGIALLIASVTLVAPASPPRTPKV